MTDAVVTTLQVTPPLETTPKGLTKAFTATALMSDGRAVPVTDNTAVSWSTSDAGIATVVTGQTSGNGVAKGEAVGTVTITAKGVVGTETFTGTAQLTVTDAIAQSLEVTPKTASVAKGLTQQYQAVVTYSDNSSEDVTAETAITSWTSGSNASINATGLAKGESVGDAQITASGTYDGVTLSDTVTLTVTAAEIVSLEVTPETASIAKGQTQAYKAMANFTDSSTLDVTDDTNTSWVSSTNAASITLEGTEAIAKGDNVGDTVITATYNGQSDTADLTVTAAVLESIEVTPDPIEVGVGSDKMGTLTAIGSYSDGTTPDITSLVDWAGQDTAIATVETGGLVTGVASNSTTTTIATLDSVSSNEVTINVIKSLLSIQVSPDNITITEPSVPFNAGVTSQQLTALGKYDDGSTDDITQEVSWSVADETIAVISPNTGGSDGGVVSNGSVSNGITSATASLVGVTSNTLSISACSTLAGPCIDVFDAGSGKLYTSPPSTAYLDSVASTATNGFNSENGVYGPVGDFYLFSWVNANALCDTYNTLSLSNRTNWRLAEKDELKVELYDTFGDFFATRDWPTYAYNWSATADGSNHYRVNLRVGLVLSESEDRKLYVSCVSNP
ncbi:hypothetical protein AJ90_22315 [Vibrio parahaemolyticus M0605]|nr:hypothetical protein AJ90_22315 [Vibrio parahaemolyticus M0605]